MYTRVNGQADYPNHKHHIGRSTTLSMPRVCAAVRSPAQRVSEFRACGPCPWRTAEDTSTHLGTSYSFLQHANNLDGLGDSPNGH